MGNALSELVRLAPLKYDPNVVQGLLIQVRRDAVGSNRTPLLEERYGQHRRRPTSTTLAATFQHKVSRNKTYLIG